MITKQLHVISTGKQSEHELIEKVLKIHPFIDFIHLREREWTAKQYISVIKKLIDLGVGRQKIIVNDRVDVAASMNVFGVQLASYSVEPIFVKTYHPSLQIGCSVHGVEEAVVREQEGARYLIYGHIFSTSSKPNVPPRGLAKLRCVVHSVNIPVIAIGGITPARIDEVMKAGAKGVAVLSGILLADDVKQAVQQYRKALDKQN